MILIDLLRSLFNKLGIIVLFAFFLSRSNFIKGYLIKTKTSISEKIIFSIVFGIIGIIGTYSGVPVNGAIANSRSVGVIVAGLYGGPVIGLASGLIAGIHRMVLPTGRFTAVACGLSTIIGGLMAGYASRYLKKQNRQWLFGALLTIGIEAVQMLMIILIARPIGDAVNLVKIIFIPMAFINAFGTGSFILIIEQIHKENENSAAAKASLSLKIASKTLPFLKEGLHMTSAQKVCEIIFDLSDMDAVSITNADRILGHSGQASDHHIPGNPVSTKITRKAIDRGAYVVAANKGEIQCNNSKCDLQSAVIVPLFMKEHLLGTLKLYKASSYAITQSDLELAKGLAYLFSTQLELSQLAYQETLLAKTEMKALQAQIQPHFLFNALNTIISYCRTDALKARELLSNLSVYLRTSFKNNDGLIPILDEIGHVKNYLSIEEARFSNRLHVRYDIDEGLDFLVPPLILQPLVENALKHGLSEKSSDCLIDVIVKEQADCFELQVWDNGSGMDQAKVDKIFDDSIRVDGIGLRNVIYRIKGIYNADVTIDSTEGEGTRISMQLPKDKAGNPFI